MKFVSKLYPDIPYATMMTWRNQDWWKPALRELREQESEKLDARLTKVINKSLDAMEDRLENGDERVFANGLVVNQKIGFRDLAVAGLAIGFDKRALGRGDPTSRTEVVSDKDRLDQLQNQFKQIARQEKPVLDGEYEEVE